MTPAIKVAGLGKTFRRPGRFTDLLRGRLWKEPIVAVDNVSFEVAPGEVLCLMGPNGAGKSTILRILAGMLTPSRGSANVLGIDVRHADDSYRSRVGYVVGDERSLHWRLTGRENLAFFAALHGLSVTEGARRATQMLEAVGLGEAADRLVKEYSRGMRQRLAVARGLLGDPEVLLLDEPTLGLDPRGAAELRRFLRRETIGAAKRTAIVGSNDPLEVETMGDRVLLLDHGALAGTIAPHQVRAELGIA